MLLTIIAKSFFTGSFAVKLIMLALLGISIAGFAAFLQKFTILKLNLLRILKFEESLTAQLNIDNIVEANRSKPNNPLAFSLILLSDTIKKNAEKINAISNVIKISQIETRQRLSYLEKYFSIFTAISPLLGLLGTVVGIIEVFESISSANIQNVTLNLIAPGISGALVTTILGILVSVINSIFLSYCMSKRQIIENKNNIFLYSQANTLIQKYSGQPVHLTPESTVVQNTFKEENISFETNNNSKKTEKTEPLNLEPEPKREDVQAEEYEDEDDYQDEEETEDLNQIIEKSDKDEVKFDEDDTSLNDEMELNEEPNDDKKSKEKKDDKNSNSSGGGNGDDYDLDEL